MTFIDERFLDHRRRAASLAGFAGGILAVGLWAYHYFADHIWKWELFAIAVTIALVKQTTLLWYRLRG